MREVDAQCSVPLGGASCGLRSVASWNADAKAIAAFRHALTQRVEVGCLLKERANVAIGRACLRHAREDRLDRAERKARRRAQQQLRVRAGLRLPIRAEFTEPTHHALAAFVVVDEDLLGMRELTVFQDRDHGAGLRDRARVRGRAISAGQRGARHLALGCRELLPACADSVLAASGRASVVRLSAIVRESEVQRLLIHCVEPRECREPLLASILAGGHLDQKGAGLLHCVHTVLADEAQYLEGCASIDLQRQCGDFGVRAPQGGDGVGAGCEPIVEGGAGTVRVELGLGPLRVVEQALTSTSDVACGRDRQNTEPDRGRVIGGQ